MSYLPRNNRLRLSPWTYGPVGFLAIFFVVLQFSVPHLLPSFFTSIAEPFWRISFSASQGALDSREVLLKENLELRLLLDDLSLRSDSLEMLAIENQKLKSLFNRDAPVWPYVRMGGGTTATTSSSTPNVSGTTSSSTRPTSINFDTARQSPFLLSAILQRPPSLSYDMLIIDVGTDNGIQNSDRVFTSGNVLIGTVVDALEGASKVRLLTSPGESFQVYVGTNKIGAKASGRGGGQYEAQISRDMKVSAGDLVYSPSIGGEIIGIVTHVVTDPTEPFQIAIIIPPTNIYSEDWVLVEITKSGKKSDNTK